MRYEEENTGEWERDSMGRKFRRVGKRRMRYESGLAM